MNSTIRSLPVCLCVFLCLFGLAWGEEGVKVICASRADKPPVMDGVLDEPAWQTAEVRSDFTSPGGGQALKRRTTMRALYDQNNIYLGFEVFWDDAELLKAGVSAIKAKYPSIAEGVWMKEWKYANTYGMELFIDPGAGGRNYYQMLFNAAGQCVGNYKGMLEYFNIQPEVKSAIREKCWSVELRYPAKDLKAGQEWGLNVCRNDETYYGTWKQVGTEYANPKLFGRLVLGDYREWWEAVGGTGVRTELEAIQRNSKSYAKRHADFNVLADQVADEMDAMSQWASRYPPVSRENFERLYERYDACRDQYARLRAYQKMLLLLAKVR